MNKKITLSAVAVLLAVTAVYFFQNNSSRKQYEQYLLSEWSQLDQSAAKSPDSVPKMDRPDMAAFQDYYEIIDPVEKTVPTERLREARQIRNAVRNKSSRVESPEWNSISSNMGGRTRSLMWDPNASSGNKVWAGSVTGGLWYNDDITDQFSEWQPVSDLWENLSISSIAYDPNHTDTYYVGTGELETAIVTYRESSGKGVGIWKSEDAGETWTLLPSTEDFAYVTDIVIKDMGSNQSVIYAGVGSGNYKGQIHNSLPEDGLYASSDGGATWEQVLPDIPGDDVPYTPNDLEITNDGTIFVGTNRNINGNGGATILYSKFGTPGTWNVYDDVKEEIEDEAQYNLPGRVALAAAPSTENTVYAVFGAGYTDGWEYHYGRYMRRTDDGGSSWSEINLPTDNGDWASLAWHALAIDVDPNNENHIFMGGLDVYHSINGGSSWYHVSDWAMMYYGGGDEYVHADIHAIQFKPGSTTDAVFGTDGGVFYTDDGNDITPDFKQMNRGYSTLQFYSGDLSSNAGEDKYLGGLQDNGSLYYEGSPLNIDDMLSGGDGAFCFFDKDNPLYFITSIYYNRYYIYYNGTQANSVGINSGTFVCPADYDSDGRLYANGCDFFGNDADEIMRISGLPYGSNTNFLDMNTGTEVPFTALKLSLIEDNMLYFGSQSGRLFRATNMDGTPAVEEITGDDFPVASISCIEEGNSLDTLMVTFSNYGVNSIWYSTDAGTSWIDVEGNLPDMPVRWAIFHPQNNEQALIATELGVWETNELGTNDVEWEPSVDGMPAVRVDMLKVRPSDNGLLAATHGRGLFDGTYPLDKLIVGNENISEVSTTVYPNPTSGEITVRGSESINSILLMDMQGRKILEERAVGQSNRSINLNNYNVPRGQYLIIVETAGEKYSEKIILL